MNLETGLIIIGVAILLLVLFCIPVLLKLRQAVSDINITLQTLNERLPLILKNMEEISTNINQATTAVNAQVQSYALTSSRINFMMNEAVSKLEMVAPLALYSPLVRKISSVIPVLKGVSAFFSVLSGKEKA